MDAKRGPKLMMETARHTLVKGTSEKAIAKRKIVEPGKDTLAEKFCLLILEGHTIDKAVEFSGITDSKTNRNAILTKYRPWIYARIRENTKDIMADGILRVQQRIKVKEGILDGTTTATKDDPTLQDGASYIECLKLRHDMAKNVEEGKKNDIVAPRLTLIIEKDKNEERIKLVDADSIQTPPSSTENTG